jgi:hypothetical protein
MGLHLEKPTAKQTRSLMGMRWATPKGWRLAILMETPKGCCSG